MQRNPAANQGTAHPMARLNEWQICGIMARYLQGEEQKSIAKDCGVTKPHVCRIVHRHVWGHLFDQRETE